jgi:hypothetical protein
MENSLVVLLLLNITQLQNKYSGLYCLLSDCTFFRNPQNTIMMNMVGQLSCNLPPATIPIKMLYTGAWDAISVRLSERGMESYSDEALSYIPF